MQIQVQKLHKKLVLVVIYRDRIEPWGKEKRFLILIYKSLNYLKMLYVGIIFINKVLMSIML